MNVHIVCLQLVNLYHPHSIKKKTIYKDKGHHVGKVQFIGRALIGFYVLNPTFDGFLGMQYIH